MDITCTVSGYEAGTESLVFQVAAVDGDTGTVAKASHVRLVRDGAETDDLEVEANGEYRLVWNAAADLGPVRCTNMVVRVTFDAHGMVQLWENGPYWAKTDIGAEEPWEYGLYFWWGDTVGYRYENETWVASDGSGNTCSFHEDESIYTYGKTLEELRSGGWITDEGLLAPEHDAVKAKWGGKWRMPTAAEFEQLCRNCDYEWTVTNGVSGYEMRGRGDYADASIFFPNAGEGYWNGFNYGDSFGFFWSSTPNLGANYSIWDAPTPDDIGDMVWALACDPSYGPDVWYYVRHYGYPIRPVRGSGE